MPINYDIEYPKLQRAMEQMIRTNLANSEHIEQLEASTIHAKWKSAMATIEQLEGFITEIWPLVALKSRILEKHPEFQYLAPPQEKTDESD